MQTILQLNSSLSGAAGQSSQLAGGFAAALGRASGARVTVRDLAIQPVPHLTLERFQAFGTPLGERTLEQQRYVAESDALVDELRRADAIVLGISPDSVKSHVAFKRKFDLPFPLLADTEHAVCEAYGVWSEKSMYGKTYMGIIRTTFVIDEKGKIENIIEKVDTKNHSAQII
jgi:hypothetical protein